MTAVADTSAPAEKLTPMMAQYFAVKKAHPGLLLFYRMGDFYELFFDDAVQASAALDIALTKRGQHLGQDIPMCGVPVHSHTGYLARLIKAGFRVAICEQTESPEEAKKRGGKSLVERAVVRIITPGTLTEDSLLEARSHNYLLTVLPFGAAELALAWCDLSTGAFEVDLIARAALSGVLARVQPTEVLLPEAAAEAADIRAALDDVDTARTLRPGSLFDPTNCKDRLLSFFGVQSTDSWGALSGAEITAAGALLDYVLLTQVGARPAFTPPSKQTSRGLLEIDAATRRNLELAQTMSGERKGSLLSVLDRTVSAGGARLMAARLAGPLADRHAIVRRLASVGWATASASVRDQVRALLRTAPDLERALSRLALDRGGPRDLAAVRDALHVARQLYVLLTEAKARQPLPDELQSAYESLSGHSAVIDVLQRALAPELPMLARDGGFIAKGYAAALDEALAMRDDSRRLILALQAQYAEKTGLSGLKIKHNNIIGYHVELPAAQADKLLSGPCAMDFIHRQTMANAARFTTTELAGLEREISSAADRALALELELFAKLRSDVLTHQAELLVTSHALAVLDVSTALADLAVSSNWCCPEMTDGLDFDIVAGRHPVVEEALRAEAKSFAPNQCALPDAAKLWLITGPNMAGKSTFLRQNAVMVVLAQMGSFVPADKATIGVVDKLFSRVGAADDLARGRSTFMVEMVETATILNRATDRSLVILDEIGRGTATFDGLSIAWAVVEHLHAVCQCRGLFATHYHELTALAQTLDHLACYTMRVKEWQGEVVFLHEVVAGTADRSYGIHVAQLAGLPQPVIARAKTVLALLEDGQKDGARQGGKKAGAALAASLPLFDAMLAPAPLPQAVVVDDPLRSALKALQPDELTPKAALEALYQLKSLLGS